LQVKKHIIVKEETHREFFSLSKGLGLKADELLKIMIETFQSAKNEMNKKDGE